MCAKKPQYSHPGCGLAAEYRCKFQRNNRDSLQKYAHPNSSEYTEEVAQGKIYVLAASALENPKLLLASNAANSSDQVGRNLMDHLVMLTWGLFPEKFTLIAGQAALLIFPPFAMVNLDAISPHGFRLLITGVGHGRPLHQAPMLATH